VLLCRLLVIYFQLFPYRRLRIGGRNVIRLANFNETSEKYGVVTKSYLFCAKFEKSDEGVSTNDTLKSSEQIAAKMVRLQSSVYFPEVSTL